MARKPSARVVLARSALDRVDLAVADGVTEFVRTVIEVAEPPDATPYGEGLVTRGGWLVYAGPNKVAGGSLDGRQPKKPRALRVRDSHQIQGIAGFGFPGRFQEHGTATQAAQPFLTPVVVELAPHAPAIMAPAAAERLR